MTAAIVLGVFALSLGMTHSLARKELFWALLDHPNERSLHERPVPRGGGIAIAGALLSGVIGVALLARGVTYTPWIMVSAGLIIAVSFVDDLSHVHPLARILVQLLAAAVLLYSGLAVESVYFPGWEWRPGAITAVAVSLLFVTWMVNLYNFMDGMDGFAAGMAVIGFGCFALMSQPEHPAFSAFCWMSAAAAGGFLVYNFPPAQIFMGDVGSSLLGFLAAALSLWASKESIFPLWAAVLVFSPFIVDATVTLARRLARGERVWEAHKSHYYQRLVQLGWGHRRTVLAEYGLMVACSLSALVALSLPVPLQWLLLAGWVVVYVFLMVLVERAKVDWEGAST